MPEVEINELLLLLFLLSSFSLSSISSRYSLLLMVL